MKKKITLIVVAVVIVLVAFLGLNSFVTIPEGYVGLRYRWGKIVDVQSEAGLHFKLPFIENVVKVDAREQVFSITTTAYTKDSQTVEALELKVNYILNKAEIIDLQRSVGISNAADKLILPQVNTILKNEIGQYRAEELIQNRNNIQEKIEDNLRAQISSYGIEVMSLSIVNIDFDDSFEEAVRAKVVAEQDALKAQNKTKEIEEQAKQIVIEAQAQADSNRLIADAEAYAIDTIADALKQNPDYIELEKIKKWDGSLPQAMGNEVNPFISIAGE